MLKKLFALSLVMGLLAVTTGCPSKDKKSGTRATAAGGTGKSETDKQTDKPADKPVSLTIDDIDTVKVTQGGESPVTIKVKRENLPAELTLEFKNLPDGVTFKQEAKDLKIPADKDSAEFTIQAKGDAKTGKSKEIEVFATAAPASGLKTPATNKFTVDVAAKGK